MNRQDYNCFQICYDDLPIIRFHADGSVWINPDLEPEEACQKAWEVFKIVIPQRFLDASSEAAEKRGDQ